jgi:hypothetical protein
MEGICESGYETSGSIKCRDFLDWLKIGYILQMDSTIWSKYVIKEVNIWIFLLSTNKPLKLTKI